MTVSERTERQRGFSLLSLSHSLSLSRPFSFFRPPRELLHPSTPSLDTFPVPRKLHRLFAIHFRRSVRSRSHPLSPRVPLFLLLILILRHLRPSERAGFPFRNPQPLPQGRVLPFSLPLYLSLTDSGRRCSAVIGSFYAAIFTFLLKATSLCR